MANVKFFNVAKQQTFDNLATKEVNALYFIQDTQRLYHADKLMGTGMTASESASGLLSAEDYKKLQALINAGPTSQLVPVDATVIITDNKIGVQVSQETGNLIAVKSDGLFVPTPEEVVIPEYAVEKQEVATDGSQATYKLKKIIGTEESYVGDPIEIPVDKVLKSAVAKAVTEDGVPYESAKIGDTYIEMTFNSDDVAPIYVPMTGDGAVIAEVKIDEANANGIVMTDAGIALNLATTTSAGAMSPVDKVALDTLVALDIENIFATKEELQAVEAKVLDSTNLVAVERARIDVLESTVEAIPMVYATKDELTKAIKNVTSAPVWEELPVEASSVEDVAAASDGAVLKMAAPITSAMTLNKSVELQGDNYNVAQNYSQEV